MNKVYVISVRRPEHSDIIAYSYHRSEYSAFLMIEKVKKLYNTECAWIDEFELRD